VNSVQGKSSRRSDAGEGPGSSARSRAPVFVVGCPRSGTTLLYHMLLSAVNFVVYRTESQVFNLLEPRFGDFANAANFQRMLRAWKGSRLFRETGLEERELSEAVPNCRNGGEFLRAVMGAMARRQGVARFADCTPEHLLYLRRIKETLPDAIVIHVIRDGRDVALSMAKQAWIAPFPWDRGKEIEVAALYWDWIVGKGRQSGKAFGEDYMEVRFEELVNHPQLTLQNVGQFIGQTLDYDVIRKAGIGSVSKPNTSFADAESFDPVARWKKAMHPKVLANVQALAGDTLASLDYELADGTEKAGRFPFHNLYRRYWNSKLFLKQKTSAGKWFASSDLSWV
jgi:hypothetical protein